MPAGGLARPIGLKIGSDHDKVSGFLERRYAGAAIIRAWGLAGGKVRS